MQIRRIKVSHAPILLLDSAMVSAAELGTHLELNGFPTRIEKAMVDGASIVRRELQPGT